jgi:hypothetical protein
VWLRVDLDDHLPAVGVAEEAVAVPVLLEVE